MFEAVVSCWIRKLPARSPLTGEMTGTDAYEINVKLNTVHKMNFERYNQASVI